MNIREIAYMQNEWEKFLDLYNKNRKEVVFYGAGQGADWVARLFATEHIYPVKMIDNKLGGGMWNNLTVMTYNNFKEQCKDKNGVYVVITSPMHAEEISASLKEDFGEENIFSFECELYCNYIQDIPYYRTWLMENEKEFNNLYNTLGDDLSKKTLENVLKGRVSAGLQYFKEICVADQYYAKDIVTLSEQETFVDVGAYIGDTVEQITDITHGKYAGIYCFEPDSICFEILRKNTCKDERVHIFAKGAWDKKEILHIRQDAEHGSSAIGNSGDYAIELDCIDDCIGMDKKITHIKMDIEGAELKALKGCSRLIKKYMPILAICLYHRNEDFLEIPNYILSIVPEYKLYMRHHNISGTETVLYALI